MDKKHATYGDFKNGKVKCPYEPRVFNIGYLGEGKYKSKENKKYGVVCNIKDTEKKHLGYYDTPEEAFQIYKNYKEKHIKQIADQYKSLIPEILYNAIYEYEVEIDD